MYLEPVHTHDCDTCLFLGGETVIDASNNRIKYDYYVCAEGNTYVARFGEMGDYLSGPHPQANHPRLQAAHARAERLGVQL